MKKSILLPIGLFLVSLTAWFACLTLATAFAFLERPGLAALIVLGVVLWAWGYWSFRRYVAIRIKMEDEAGIAARLAVDLASAVLPIGAGFLAGAAVVVWGLQATAAGLIALDSWRGVGVAAAAGLVLEGLAAGGAILCAATYLAIHVIAEDGAYRRDMAEKDAARRTKGD
jgi:hypothetical protein